jgi:hypothetical protein
MVALCACRGITHDHAAGGGRQPEHQAPPDNAQSHHQAQLDRLATMVPLAEYVNAWLYSAFRPLGSWHLAHLCRDWRAGAFSAFPNASGLAEP